MKIEKKVKVRVRFLEAGGSFPGNMIALLST